MLHIICLFVEKNEAHLSEWFICLFAYKEGGKKFITSGHSWWVPRLKLIPDVKWRTQSCPRVTASPRTHLVKRLLNMFGIKSAVNGGDVNNTFCNTFLNFYVSLNNFPYRLKAHLQNEWLFYILWVRCLIRFLNIWKVAEQISIYLFIFLPVTVSAAFLQSDF